MEGYSTLNVNSHKLHVETLSVSYFKLKHITEKRNTVFRILILKWFWRLVMTVDLLNVLDDVKCS